MVCDMQLRSMTAQAVPTLRSHLCMECGGQRQLAEELLRPPLALHLHRRQAVTCHGSLQRGRQ